MSPVKNSGKIAARRSAKKEQEKIEADAKAVEAQDKNNAEMVDVINMLLEEEDRKQNEAYDRAFEYMTAVEVSEENNMFKQKRDINQERVAEKDIAEGVMSEEISLKDNLQTSPVKSAPVIESSVDIVRAETDTAGTDSNETDTAENGSANTDSNEMGSARTDTNETGTAETSNTTFSTEDIKKSVMMNIKEQIEQLQSSSDIRKVDVSKYTSDAKYFNIYYKYLLGFMSIPAHHITTLPLNEYINNTTIFDYNCFDSPKLSMGIQIPEKVMLMDKLSKLFNYEFINTSTNDFHFADTDLQLVKFLFEHRNVPTTKLEYNLIKSFIGKLIICLNSEVELAFRDEKTVRLDASFRQCVSKDMQLMKHFQSSDGKSMKSWKVLTNSMLSLDGESDVYVYHSLGNLKNNLKDAYNHDFLLESLLGSMLKCYLPSIAINYFYALKGVYITARLISIYMEQRLFKDKDTDAICDDMFVIGSIAAIIYESLAFVYKMIPRTLPSYKQELSKHTHMYITNHLLVGGQYYILKMFIESFPVLNAIMKDL